MICYCRTCASNQEAVFELVGKDLHYFCDQCGGGYVFHNVSLRSDEGDEEDVQAAIRLDGNG